MSTQSTITLDAIAYSPAGVSGGIATWFNRTINGVANALKLTESVVGPSKAGVFRVRFKMDMPVIASEDTVCACAGTVLGTAVANLDILVPAAFSAADRESFQLQLTALAASAEFVNAVKNLEGTW